MVKELHRFTILSNAAHVSSENAAHTGGAPDSLAKLPENCNREL
jgi:hypothetical protein